jgi:hypothetical protein
MVLTVPTPGGSAFRVPSGAIVKFDPHLIPPRLPVVAGTRSIVPVVVIVPPERPTPAVIDEIVPPSAEETSNVPSAVTAKPDPRTRFPEGVETL